jgi:hypothetical protein
VSNDNGVTFGPTLKLTANGTIGSSEVGNGEAEISEAAAEIQQQGEVKVVAEAGGGEQRTINHVGYDFNIPISIIGSEESLLLQSQETSYMLNLEYLYYLVGRWRQ